MEKEEVSVFKGKFVKLTYKNGFNLKGTIHDVHEDTIYFITKQASSLIPYEEIYSIVELKGGY